MIDYGGRCELLRPRGVIYKRKKKKKTRVYRRSNVTAAEDFVAFVRENHLLQGEEAFPAVVADHPHVFYGGFRFLICTKEHSADEINSTLPFNVFTDGSFISAQNKAGYGIFYRCQEQNHCLARNVIVGSTITFQLSSDPSRPMPLEIDLSTHKVSSMTMELLAILEGIVYVQSFWKQTSIFLYTDSLESLYLVEKFQRKPSNLRYHVYENILVAIAAAAQQSKVQRIHLFKVKAHANIFGNEAADRLAHMGAASGRPLQKFIISDQGTTSISHGTQAFSGSGYGGTGNRGTTTSQRTQAPPSVFPTPVATSSEVDVPRLAPTRDHLGSTRSCDPPPGPVDVAATVCRAWLWAKAQGRGGQTQPVTRERDQGLPSNGRSSGVLQTPQSQARGGHDPVPPAPSSDKATVPQPRMLPHDERRGAKTTPNVFSSRQSVTSPAATDVPVQGSRAGAPPRPYVLPVPATDKAYVEDTIYRAWLWTKAQGRGGQTQPMTRERDQGLPSNGGSSSRGTPQAQAREGHDPVPPVTSSDKAVAPQPRTLPDDERRRANTTTNVFSSRQSVTSPTATDVPVQGSRAPAPSQSISPDPMLQAAAPTPQCPVSSRHPLRLRHQTPNAVGINSDARPSQQVSELVPAAPTIPDICGTSKASTAKIEPKGRSIKSPFGGVTQQSSAAELICLSDEDDAGDISDDGSGDAQIIYVSSDDEVNGDDDDEVVIVPATLDDSDDVVIVPATPDDSDVTIVPATPEEQLRNVSSSKIESTSPPRRCKISQEEIDSLAKTCAEQEFGDREMQEIWEAFRKERDEKRSKSQAASSSEVVEVISLDDEPASVLTWDEFQTLSTAVGADFYDDADLVWIRRNWKDGARALGLEHEDHPVERDHQEDEAVVDKDSDEEVVELILTHWPEGAKALVA
ncbi:hypothetical protein SELMODRAFT_427944 [Selaginella moellendorffii]|uniref:ribonuclease H n=1 Tax=Selaginella moellendorffii TaxID=88036 RepID=D8T173_SELML|nr:hypothetical protein SELMODRAFT_427944 [Selaginella moellendorffii]